MWTLREARAADVSQSMPASVIPQVAFCLVSDRAANLIRGGGRGGGTLRGRGSQTAGTAAPLEKTRRTQVSCTETMALIVD